METSQFKQQQSKSIRWNTIMSILTFLVQFVCLYFLNKWFTPEDFGQSAWALGVTTIGLVFTNFAFVQVLLRQEETSGEDMNGLFVFAALWNSLLFAIFFFGVANLPIKAAMFSKPYIQAFSFSFLANTLMVLPYVLLAKQFKFSLVSSIRLVTKLISVLFSLFFGVKGMVFWSLFFLYAGGNILYYIALACSTNWIIRAKPQFHFLKREFSTALSFLSHKILNSVGESLDKILVGQRFGDDSLGQYHKSYGYKSLPYLYIADPIAQVTFPMFSQAKNNREQLSKMFLDSQNLIAFILLPLLFTFLALAKPFAYIYFSANETNWDVDLIAQLLVLFGWAGVFSVFAPNFYSLFSAVSSKKQINTLIFYQRIFLVLIIIFTYRFGLIPLAIGILISEVIAILSNVYVSSKYVVPSQLNYSLLLLVYTVFIATVSSISAYVLFPIFSKSLHEIPAFLIACITSALLYLLLSFYFNKGSFQIFRSIISTSKA